MINYNIIVSILALLLLSTCTDNASTDKNINKDAKIEVTDSGKKKVTIEDRFKPSNFEKYGLMLDSIGYVNDTSTYKLIANGGLAQYPKDCDMIFTESGVILYNLFSADNGLFHLGVSKEEKNIFHNAQSGLGYYYVKNQTIYSTNKIDGFITEWKFTSSNEVDSACKIIELYRKDVFLNVPFVTEKRDNYLYLFYTRATKFESDLTKVVELFKKNNN